MNKNNGSGKEILFRAKRIDNGEWVEGIPSYDITGNLTEFEVYCGYADCKTHEVDCSTICQYTGKIDRDGIRIYEKDICIIFGEEEDGYFIIEWDKDNAKYIISGEGLIVDFDNYHGRELEIVGNAFDNPELLGG